MGSTRILVPGEGRLRYLTEFVTRGAAKTCVLEPMRRAHLMMCVANFEKVSAMVSRISVWRLRLCCQGASRIRLSRPAFEPVATGEGELSG